jgi:hypothetical protein
MTRFKALLMALGLVCVIGGLGVGLHTVRSTVTTGTHGRSAYGQAFTCGSALDPRGVGENVFVTLSGGPPVPLHFQPCTDARRNYLVGTVMLLVVGIGLVVTVVFTIPSVQSWSDALRGRAAAGGVTWFKELLLVAGVLCVIGGVAVGLHRIHPTVTPLHPGASVAGLTFSCGSPLAPQGIGQIMFNSFPGPRIPPFNIEPCTDARRNDLISTVLLLAVGIGLTATTALTMLKFRAHRPSG